MPLKIASFFRPASSAPRRRASRNQGAGAARFESLENRRLLSTDLVSAGTGATGAAVEGALEPSVSADGNLIAFSSDATNFGATDTNGVRDVYLHNRANGTTVLVSRTPAGVAGNGVSSEPSISTDGAFVSFSSMATDIGAGRSPTKKQIYLYEVATQTVTQVSLTTTGGQPDEFSAEPNTSSNGNFVAFTSVADAPTLAAGTTDPNHLRDVYLWNRGTGATQLVSTTTTVGTAGNAASFDPSVSADGRFVAFRSDSNDLVPTVDANSQRDIYLRDMTGGATILVSRTSAGLAGKGQSDSPSVSADGNYVVFSSVATDLTGDDTNGAVRDIFLFNRADNSVTLVTHNQARTGSGDKDSSEPSISQDGRFIAFTSLADDLVANDTNNASDIFVYDIQTGAMNRVSVDSNNVQANGDSSDANIAPLGLFVAFTSKATNLTAADANGAVNDAFVASAPDRSQGNTNPPTASVAPIQPPAVIGTQFIDFIVNYADDVDLATTTFDSNDITVTPPGGTPQPVTFVSSTGSGTAATATYRMAAPGGSVDAADAGAYTITIQPGQVKDANNNAVAAGPLPAVQVTPTTGDGPDLVPAIVGPLPAVVGGSKGKARVTVTNAGNKPTPKGAAMTLQLWLSADGTVDPAVDTLLGTQTKKFSAKPGKGKKYNFKFLYNAPAGGPNYQMLAVADSGLTITETNEFNNVATSPVNVSPPFVELATSVGAAKPTARPGKKFGIPVTLTNNGNVPAKGTISYNIVASTDDVLGNADDVLITPVALTKTLTLKNGPKGKRSNVSVLLPTTLSGAYRFFVTSTFNGTPGDTDTSNNTDSTDNVVTVSA